MPKFKNRSGIIHIPVIIFIVALLVVGGVFAIKKLPSLMGNDASEVSAVPTSIAATVTYLTGNAWQSVDGRKVEIKEQDVLSEGAELMTDAGSRMVLVFDEGSVVRLDENTHITLDKALSSEMVIDEKAGLIFSRVQKDENHKFIVQAGTVRVESLGTSFSVENSDEVNVKVFESKVKVSKTFGSEKEVKEQEEWKSEKEEVAAINNDEVLNDEFLAWSLTEKEVEKVEKKKEVKEEPTDESEEEKEEETEDAPSNSVIKLSGKQVDNGIFVSWATNLGGEGFKIVKSTSSSPTFPDDGYVYVDDDSVRNYTLLLKDGKTYHIRVCRYLGGGKCDNYSNDITVTAPKVESSSSKDKSSDSDVSSIYIKVQKKSDSSVKVYWDVKGESEKGYKVVWSENSGPTYPTRSGDKFHYLDDEDARSDTVSGLGEDEKYYFRVCEYLGGKCGTYSNEVSIEL
jgi:hypothetical protein